MSTTDVLLGKALSGSSEAQNSLFARSQPQILGWAMRKTRCDETASDIAQDTLMILERTWRRCQKTWRGFVHKTTILAYKKWLRERGKIQPRQLPESNSSGWHPQVNGPSLSETIVQSELRAELMAKFATLREIDREVVRLRIWEKLSFREIGARIGISTGAARKRYGRGIRALAEKMAPYVYEK